MNENQDFGSDQSPRTTGEKITEYLLKHKNLKGIAKKAGIPYQSLFDMKKRNTYTTETMDILAKALGITVSELIGEELDTELLDRKAEEIKKQFPSFIDKIVKKV